ncbi:MAG TPA: hypothetical protein VFR58_15750 [Flavisolibacter sp.]|nr:hypothetical protein [Flavisolibacter sp.]
MKKRYLALLLPLFAGCIKEKIEKKQENMVIQAVVNGQWKVTSFTKGSNDVTTQFSTYKFQFRENRTVEAINNGAVESTGSWDADADSKTITTQFPTLAQPLVYFNGTWNISSTTWTSVKASLSTGGETSNLRLDKL